MAEWSSNPSVPHSGGTFNFPANTTSEDKVYTINYIDDNGCSTSTTYTVQASTCLSSFTATEIESSFCSVTYSARTKDCQGIIPPRLEPTVDYDSSKFICLITEIRDGFDVLGHQIRISTISNGKRVYGDYTFTIHSTVGDASSSFTSSFDCCREPIDKPLVKPTFIDDLTKNYISIGVAIDSLVPVAEPTGGTVSYDWEMKWGPCPGETIPFIITGTYSGEYGNFIDINREECTGMTPYKELLSFTTTNIVGNLTGPDCITYTYENLS